VRWEREELNSGIHLVDGQFPQLFGRLSYKSLPEVLYIKKLPKKNLGNCVQCPKLWPKFLPRQWEAKDLGVGPETLAVPGLKVDFSCGGHFSHGDFGDGFHNSMDIPFYS